MFLVLELVDSYALFIECQLVVSFEVFIWVLLNYIAIPVKEYIVRNYFAEVLKCLVFRVFGTDAPVLATLALLQMKSPVIDTFGRT